MSNQASVQYIKQASNHSALIENETIEKLDRDSIKQNAGDSDKITNSKHISPKIQESLETKLFIAE